MTVNLRILHSQTFLEARSQNVSLQDATTCCSCYRLPKRFLFSSFFLHELAIFWPAKKRRKDTFVPPSIPFPRYCLQLQQWWYLYCFAIIGSTSIVIHSVKQRLLRNRPGSDAATSRDFLRERLQRAFTPAKQLHLTAQYRLSMPLQ